MVIQHDNPLLSHDEVGLLVGAAGAAPSMHNTQPWRFEVTGTVIDVLLDEDRTLPAEDHSGRMTRIGLGAAAFNLRVAAAMLGYDTTLAIDPDPDRPDIAVRVFLGARHPARNSPIGALYSQLHRRHTYRGPLVTTSVPHTVLDQLSAAARAEGAELRWLDPAARHKLGRTLQEAEALELHDEDRLTERGRWVGGNRTADGIPATALGPLPSQPAAVRDLSAGYDDPARDAAPFETDPLIAILTTTAEDQVAWTRAGMALQHSLLTATTYDVVASFLNQAIEYASLRPRIQELVGHSAHPQMILRVGYPAESPTETPRRAWHDTLEIWQ